MSFAENRRIALVTLVVDDYDRAKAFYCDVLGFECLSDQPLGDGKRWLVVKPQGTEGGALLLAEADGEQQRLAIGNQTGGRVGFFLHTTISSAITRPCLPAVWAFWRSRAMRFTAPLRSLLTLTEIVGIFWNRAADKP